MTVRAAEYLIISIAVTIFWAFLFVRGLRQRTVITTSNLEAQRDRTPVLYWIFQTYYALVVIVFAFASVLIASDYKFVGEASIGRLFLAPVGVLFLFAAVICCALFTVGLRTGTAIRRTWPFEPDPPTRKQRPVRYWALQVSYIFFAIITAFLGLVCIVVIAK